MKGRRDMLSWFPMHVADWMASDTVAELVSAVGGAGESAYLRLLLRQWRNAGEGLPAEPSKLRAMTVATPKEWALAWPILEPRFPIVADGRRANPRVVDEWAKVVGLREARSESGRRGNAKRWNGDDEASDSGSPGDREPIAPRSPDGRSCIAPEPEPEPEPTDKRARAFSVERTARDGGLESLGAIVGRLGVSR